MNKDAPQPFALAQGWLLPGAVLVITLAVLLGLSGGLSGWIGLAVLALLVGWSVWLWQRRTARLQQLAEAARASEERFAKAFDLSPFAITVTSLATGRLVAVNETFVRICKCPREEALGRTTLELGLWADPEERAAQFAAVAANGQLRDREHRFQLRGGRELVGLLSAGRIEFNGEPCMLTVIADITNYKRAEAERRRNEELLRLAFTAGRAGAWEWNAGRKRVHWSDELFALFELPPQSFRPTFDGWFQSMHPDDRARLQPLVERALQEDTEFAAEYRCLWPDGKQRWLETRARILRNEQGAALRAVGVTSDISARKRDEEALRLSEERFRRIVETASEGIWVLDLEGQTQYANAQMAGMLGCAVDDLARRRLHDFIFEEDWPRIAEIRAYLSTHVRAGFDFRYRRQDGSAFWAHVSTTAIRDDQGALVGALGMFTDISERKRAEAQARLLAELGELMRYVTDPDELLYSVARAVGAHLQVKRCLFNEVDVEQDWARVYRDYHRDVPSLAGEHRLTDDLQETLVEVISGRTAVNSDAQTDPRTAEYYTESHAQHGVRAYVAVPMRRDGCWISTLFVSDEQPRQWRRDEIELLETVAARVWLALENARLFRELSESEERLRLAQEAGGIGVWEWAPATDETFWSERSWEIYGLAPFSQPVTFELWQGCLHPEDRERAAAVVREMMETLPDRHYDEFRVLHPDGQVRYVVSLGRTVRDAEGRATRIVGVHLDTTRQKQTEEELRYQLDLTRTITDNTQSCLLMMDAQGRCTFANPAAERITGYCAQELIGQVLHNVIHHTHPDGTPFPIEECPLDRALPAQEAVVDYEDTFVHKDGHFYPVRCAARPIYKGGQPSGTVIEVQDITEEKQAAAEREQLLLTERAAREAADAAVRTKEEFIAVVSHELRAPLNAMFGWARVLKGGKYDQATLEHAIDVIERSARMQQELIEDLLDTARIMNGKLRLDHQPVDLVQVIEAAADAVRPSAEAKDLHLQLEFKSRDVVTGDADRMQQVVWNLLANAVKFTPRGGRIRVRLERRDPHMCITVSDTGKGICPALLPHIFDRFQQADSTSSRRHGGLGLGLALVHHLVQLHGGQVEAHSPGEGQGATFTVHLPLRAVRAQRVEVGRAKTEKEMPLPSLIAHPSLAGVSILVVDDEPDARDLLVTLLKQYGAQVTTAESAAAARAALEAAATAGELPQILISDIGMPGEDGYQLIGQIRALPPERGGQLPAIALTAFGRTTDRIRALAAGFQTHLVKPVEPVELAVVIAGLTERPNNDMRAGVHA
jgi:PAS domain S-box-containing protein